MGQLFRRNRYEKRTIAAYADVTRVGGEYEETLAAVAGMPDPKWR